MITIDPGKRYFAYAWWQNGKLAVADLVEIEQLDKLDPHQFAVIEKQWGVARSEGVREKDILDLALATGIIGGHFRTRRFDPPSSCPKPQRHRQAKDRLSPDELAVLPTQKTKLKHVMCAVWIGLKELGRLRAVQAA